MTTIRRAPQPRLKAVTVFLAAFALTVIFAATANAATPSNTGAPAITGSARAGQTLTATNGTWANSPTTFTYQWQRCNLDGTGCADIATATMQTYMLTATDVDNRVRVTVTASNTDGTMSASSDPSEVVSSTAGPTASTNPTITGTATPGEALTAQTGTWTGATSFTYQWLACSPGTPFTCASVAGAVGSTYGVRSADVGMQIRVVVRASDAAGDHSSATADPTATVAAAATPTPTPVVTTPAPVVSTKPPTVAFQSLKRIGKRVYLRMEVCASQPGSITIVERDTKALSLSFTRTFKVSIGTCGSVPRNWIPAARFRTHGRYTVTLRPQNSSGTMGVTRSKSLAI